MRTSAERWDGHRARLRGRAGPIGSTYGVGTGIMVASWVECWLTSVGSARLHPRIWSLRHVLIALVAVVVAVVVTLVTGLLFKRRLERGSR